MSVFKGKVALVTGAGSGIGEAAAVAFAAAGARGVALAGRRKVELARVADRVGALGATPLVMPTDVSEEGQVAEMVQRTLSRFERLDAAFNNAGIEGVFAPIVECRAADFDATIAVNLRGAWLSAKHEIAAMQQLGRDGAIVNTSSWLAHGAFPAARPFVEHTPARRLGTPEDIADAVVWLCSDAARFVTAQNLLVDGGYTIPGHRAWLADAVMPSTDHQGA